MFYLLFNMQLFRGVQHSSHLDYVRSSSAMFWGAWLLFIIRGIAHVRPSCIYLCVYIYIYICMFVWVMFPAKVLIIRMLHTHANMEPNENVLIRPSYLESNQQTRQFRQSQMLPPFRICPELEFSWSRRQFIITFAYWLPGKNCLPHLDIDKF